MAKGVERFFWFSFTANEATGHITALATIVHEPSLGSTYQDWLNRELKTLEKTYTGVVVNNCGVI